MSAVSLRAAMIGRLWNEAPSPNAPQNRKSPVV
jgi:hypothetical protein